MPVRPASLAAGTRLGPYEISALIGAGGMGEVYRATDTNLRRPVAVKVLPASVSRDPGRLARFRREAQVLATLDHPQVAHVYGLETSDGVTAIVMELVEGETLDERIARGALPFADALAIARQIAEALEAAHARGIVHRDLKPANIKLRPDGRVKVLDFGLAKALDSAADSDDDSQGPTAAPDLTASGVIVGTAPYMSPEQARGALVDRRTDVWAFGCVLYEMLSGRRAFFGSTVSDTLAAILQGEPRWDALPPSAHAVAGALRRCLEKDPARRLRDIGDARIWLEEAARQADVSPATAAAAAAPTRKLGWLVAAALGLATGAAATWLLARTPPRTGPRPLARFELASTRASTFVSPLFGSGVAISPDGTRVAYTGALQGQPQLFLRRLDQTDAVAVAGTEGAEQPFFSPDGRRLGFVTVDRIAHVPTEGGQRTIVCSVEPGAVRGASWWPDDTIVFTQARLGLYRAKAGGGREPEPLLRDAAAADESVAEPSLLPGGRSVLYTVLLPGGQSRVVARRLDGGATTLVAEGGFGARYLPPGFVLFAEGDRLMAVRFDAAQLRVEGTPAAIFEGVFTMPGYGVADLSIANDGTVVYVAGGNAQSARRLVWVDRTGKRLGAAVGEFLDGARNQRLSPDGRRVAITVGNTVGSQVWVYDLTGGDQPLKLTHRNHHTFANWSADGQRIFMLHGAGSGASVRWLPADGSVLEPERVTADELKGTPFACSPDGAYLIFGSGSKNFLLPLHGGAPQPWPGTPFREVGADFSPDSRFVAYASDPSGQLELYVRPFPGPGAPVRVSAEGGFDPQWSHDGRELFFRSGAKLLAARVLSTTPVFRAERPRVLFEGGFFRDAVDTGIRFYDVAPDGRFLMLEAAGTSNASVVLVQGWAEELERRLGR